MPPIVVTLFKRKVRRLVARRELRPALDALTYFFEFVEMEAVEDELALISGQLEGAEASMRKGVLNEEDYQKEMSKISSAILSITNRYFSLESKPSVSDY